GEYEPVGGHETRRCDARFICACNVDLEEAVEAGRFRRDLYYRINVLSIHQPPLRDRVGDILPLAEAFVARAAARFHRPRPAIRAEVRAALEAFHWPGNIRQLENVLQQAVLFSAGPELRPSDLPPLIQAHAARGLGMPPEKHSLALNRDAHERELIQ